MPELGSPTEAELGVGADNALFSVPEIGDLRSRIKTFNSFGDFSTIGFTLVVLGEPRSVQGGVVGGSYFQVMGLRPVLGRLLDANDDGPNAAGGVVLTYRFWSTVLKSDPSVLGKTVRLDSFLDARPATVVGGRAFGDRINRCRGVDPTASRTQTPGCGR